MGKKSSSWFEVDKVGLAKILARKGKAFVVHELVQNAWDTMAEKVDISLVKSTYAPDCWVLRVEDDDPDGFRNLRHAYTLFAESEKKSDAEKRGRFNLGEKLVLAACEKAEIVTTRGGVVFFDGGRQESVARTERGSVFSGVIRMGHREAAEVAESVWKLLPPPDVKTTFNGHPVPHRRQLCDFIISLPTEVAGPDGTMRRMVRTTLVRVVECGSGEVPHLYEMGIPVVALEGGERWHLDVQQKVPLNMERDNVTPAYMKKIWVGLAGEMRQELEKEDADQEWLNRATGSPDVPSEVVEKVLDLRFGKKRSIFDMADREANKQLMNEGYTVITGGSLTRAQWENVKRTEAAVPSGQIRPTGVKGNPEGRPEREIEDLTDGMRSVIGWSKLAGRLLLGKPIDVRIVSEPIARPHVAWYGGSTLTFNAGRLGKDWFEGPIRPKHVELVIHELAHDKVGDHLTREFADEVARLAVRLAFLVRDDRTLLETAGH